MYYEHGYQFTSNEPESGFFGEIFHSGGTWGHNGAPYVYIPFGFVDVRAIRICFRQVFHGPNTLNSGVSKARMKAERRYERRRKAMDNSGGTVLLFDRVLLTLDVLYSTEWVGLL
jgi:hypothetical protein